MTRDDLILILTQGITVQIETNDVWDRRIRQFVASIEPSSAWANCYIVSSSERDAPKGCLRIPWEKITH